jgi:hypothetical protein
LIFTHQTMHQRLHTTTTFPRVMWKQILCGLRGHAHELHVEPARLYLKCVDCQQETPGVVLSLPPIPATRDLPRTS